MSFIRRFTDDENGATAIEYGLLVGLIAVAIVASAAAIGFDLSGHMNRAAACVAEQTEEVCARGSS